MDYPPEYSYEKDADYVAPGSGTANVDDDPDATRLIIGLDFGTTYSGVAYCFSNKPEAIYTIEDWPGAGGRTYSKCPTLIAYQNAKEFTWGFEVDKTSSSCIEGIKLLLDPDQPKPIYAPSLDAAAKLGKLGKAPVTVAADYINAVYQHAIKIIESKVPKDYLNMIPKRYVLSVPAVWSDMAKDATLRAARNAGLNPVKLIKEPEAAALFTIHSMGERGLEVGDALVLCDAGGGTVDLISYEISSLQPFELSELTFCTGGLAGSLLLNKRFEEWIKDAVGDKAFKSLCESDAYRQAMQHFDDNIKPSFRSKDDRLQWVTFPGADLEDNPAKGLKRDSLAVTGQTLFDVFEPIFREVDRLVKEQVTSARLNRLNKGKKDSRNIKAIFLVGGFGANTYMFDQITKAHSEIQVIQPQNAWSAIVRGAVMSQLPSEAQVVTSLAPKHYGVSARAIFNDLEDQGRKKIWDNEYELWRVDKMSWYIEKGDDLLRTRKIEFGFFRSFSPNPSHAQLQVVSKLLECSLDNKPIHYRDDVVLKNCRLKTDLSKVPKELFQKKQRTSRIDGTVLHWWELHYKLLVTIQSGPMLFSLLCGKKEYGHVVAEY